MSDSELFEKTQNLCKNMDSKSKQIVHRIISRTKEAELSPTNKVFCLTQDEREKLEYIHNDYRANICKVTSNIFCYQDYFLPIKHFETSVFCYKHGLDTFSPQTLQKIKNLDIIDVGGFVGDSALIFQHFTDKNIYSFEATNRSYNLMLESIRLNHAQRIVPIKKALGSEHTTMTINIYGSASSLINDVGNDKEEVEIITLDSYVNEHQLKIGLIKVDIEGFEMEFLKGAKETICQQKPAMILSIYHQASDFFDIKPLLESWNLNYTFRVYKPIDDNISLETTLMCEVL
ncbi:FkbM family methyltransferase [Helicobacter typhlonius]|uniref:FkbM family methyltransferase n=3 Tax=Helicobacter typhlonius TaxID=76936 RepID=UPI002FE0C4F0